MMTITHPCGHTADFDSSCGTRRDHYICPHCGHTWSVKNVSPPVITRDGFILPGERKVVIDAQASLPLR